MVYDSARSRVVVFAGAGQNGSHDVWEYDGATWTERTSTPSPSDRLAPCGAYDAARGVTVVFGGRSSDKETALDDTWEWDGSEWRAGPGGPPARRSCAMAYDAARDAIVMFGGSPPGRPGSGLADTWVYE